MTYTTCPLLYERVAEKAPAERDDAVHGDGRRVEVDVLIDHRERMTVLGDGEESGREQSREERCCDEPDGSPRAR